MLQPDPDLHYINSDTEEQIEILYCKDEMKGIVGTVQDKKTRKRLIGRIPPGYLQNRKNHRSLISPLRSRMVLGLGPRHRNLTESRSGSASGCWHSVHSSPRLNIPPTARWGLGRLFNVYRVKIIVVNPDPVGSGT